MQRKFGRHAISHLTQYIIITYVVGYLLAYLAPQALSYHLSKLKKADLIYETRYKNFIYYELNLSVLDEAVLWIDQLRGGPNHEEN